MASVIDQDPFNEYTANGVTTVFAYTFQLLSASDLVVKANGVVVPTSSYSVSGVGVQAGGSVTFTVAPANTTEILLSREITLARDTDYQYNGDLLETTLDRDFNRIWHAIQGVQARLDGAVRAPYPAQIAELPSTPDENPNLGFGVTPFGDPTYLPTDFGSTTANVTMYDPGLPSTIDRTVELRLRERRSVLDFDAVADWNGSTGTDNSAAFTAAFNSGYSILVPKGQYMISSTVTIQNSQGITIEGDGEDATMVAWNGANDGVMFIVVGTRHSLFQKMQLTGNNKAGTQLQLIQPDLSYTYTNTGNTYRNLRMGNNWPSSVKPIVQIGTTTGTQVDVQNFYDCKFENATKLVTQESGVTLSIFFSGCHFQAYLATATTTRAIDLISGSNVYFVGCLFVGEATQAIIYVRKEYGLLSLSHCETEIIGSGPFLYAEDDAAVSGNTASITITGSTLGFNGTGGINWIDHRRVGNLVLTGNTINSTNAVNLNHAPSAASAFIDDGNWYVNVTVVQGANSRRAGVLRNGIFRAPSTSGNLYGTGSAISGVMETKRVGTTDNNLTRITAIGTGGGTANATQCVETNTAMTTTPKKVASIEDGALILVRGTDGASNDFLDLVIATNTGTPTVISSKTLTGAPAARTYSTSSFQLFLAMGSGTYTTSAMWWQMTAR